MDLSQRLDAALAEGKAAYVQRRELHRADQAAAAAAAADGEPLAKRTKLEALDSKLEGMARQARALMDALQSAQVEVAQTPAAEWQRADADAGQEAAQERDALPAEVLAVRERINRHRNALARQRWARSRGRDPGHAPEPMLVGRTLESLLAELADLPNQLERRQVVADPALRAPQDLRTSREAASTAKA